MFRALLDNIMIDAIEANLEYGKDEDYVCPCCGSKMTLCIGNSKQPYFSHKKDEGCEESFYDGERNHEWHLYVQSLFPKECLEQKITKTYKELYPDDPDFKDDLETETHIADILIGDYVIEVQHSPMSIDEFNNRTDFYTRAGYKLIWIFDWNNKDLEVLDIRDNQYGVSYKWRVRHAPKTFSEFVPQYNKDKVALFFSIDSPEIDDIYDDCDGITLHRITWAIPKNYDEDGCDADYKCIFTQACLGENLEELAKAICKKYKKI